MQCCTCNEYSAAVVHEAEARHSGHSSNYTTQTQGQVTSQPRPGLHDVMPIQSRDQPPCIRGGGGAPWQLAGGHLQPTLVTATLYTGGVPVWPLESLVLVSLVTACGHCGGVGWSAVGAGLGCWHQPAAALPPASPETQPGRLLRAGGGTPWHSGQHTTGCNTRHHTTPPHSCLAPGSWLTSPSIAHYRGAAVCPAPWQCGHTGWGRAESAAAVSRIAAVQPSSGVLWPARQPRRTQQRPARTGSVWGECRRGAASTCSTSPAPAAGPAGGAAGGGGGAAAGGRGLRCSAPRLPRRWNDNNLTIT